MTPTSNFVQNGSLDVMVVYILMEFAAGGSLHKQLRSLKPGNKLPIHIVTDWAKQVAEGMLYLHQKNIVHRDMKSPNSKCLRIYRNCFVNGR